MNLDTHFLISQWGALFWIGLVNFMTIFRNFLLPFFVYFNGYFGNVEPRKLYSYFFVIQNRFELKIFYIVG